MTLTELASSLGQLPQAVKAAFEEWLHHQDVTELEDLQKVSGYDDELRQLRTSLPSGYTLIAESRDGRLCLFQDKDGHLVAADSHKFA